MSKPPSKPQSPAPSTPGEFADVALEQLATVAGGATRVSGRGGSSDELTSMLTQIGNSIKDLAASKNNSGGDTMQMMLMMLMMGGIGGGGGGGVAATAAAPPVVNVDTGISGGGGKRGKKGW